MPFCKFCGCHVPESEGTICEDCMKFEDQEKEELPYPLLLAPPKTKGSGKSLTRFLVISLAVGMILFFFLLGRNIAS